MPLDPVAQWPALSLDVQSLRSLTDRFLDLLSRVLGKSATGPAVVNIGALRDSLDEIPVNAAWSFPPERREELLSARERLLWAAPAGVSLSAGEPKR